MPGPQGGGDPGPDGAVRQGNDGNDVTGIGDLAWRIVHTAYLNHPRLHRALMVITWVLLTLCVAAVVVRLSAIPLLPIPPLLVAAYAAWRIPRESEHRPLLTWSAVYVAALLVGMWVISMVPRWISYLED